MISIRSTLIGSAALLCSLSALAVPADPRPKPVTQPDGSVITTRLIGDEHAHYRITSQGSPIDLGADGWWRYLTLAPDGNITLSDTRVTPRAESALSKADSGELLRAIRSRCTAKAAPARNSPRKLASSYPATGSPRALVLLVEYEDVHFTVPDAHDEFERMLNAPGYDGYGGTGSARDWFIDNSGGQFSPRFDVIGPIRLPHPRAYYGANVGGNDVRPQQMVIDACTLIDNDIDFTLYDEDSDGFIDNVFLFYAGYGENLGGDAPDEAVWPHSWDLSETTTVPYYFDGVRLNHYACTGEIDLDNRMDGIGTFVHEFSHVLGLPDLYATGYSYAFTPGEWSVLDYGPYNNNSRTPPLYSAFERLSLGWLTPQLVTRPCSLKIPPIDQNRAYRISTAADNEYFILENRQQSGWDKYIPGHGMLVWHIDYNENVWRYNTVNNREDHQYVDIEEADGDTDSDTRAGDAFPGTASVTAFTDDTTPSMRNWAGEPTNLPLTGIYESNGYIYLDVAGGRKTIPAPAAEAPSDITPVSFTAHWLSCGEDILYTLSVYTVHTSSSGKPVINSVYELSEPTAALSAQVTGLDPDTEYRYTVFAYDPFSDLKSIASNEITLTTLSPTFEYTAPSVSLDTPSLDSSSALITWLPLDEAEAYELELCQYIPGEAETHLCDFTGGISALPQGWLTSSRLTYGNAAWCGEAVPSLRLNTSGQYLEADLDNPVRSLSFWTRGVGADESSFIEVRTPLSGKWHTIASFPLSNQAGGSICQLTSEQLLPYSSPRIRLVLVTDAKASVAIDDVQLTTAPEQTVYPLAEYRPKNVGAALDERITSLSSESLYGVRVRGLNRHSLYSLWSEPLRFITPEAVSLSGIHTPCPLKVIPAQGMLRITGTDCDTPLRLIDLCGKTVARTRLSGGEAIIYAAPGIYILQAGNVNMKVYIK